VAVVAGKRDVVLPLEVLRVLEGQRVTPELSTRQRTALVDLTCMAPAVRIEMARKHAASLAAAPALKAEGVLVSDQVLSVPARVLPPPVVKMFGNTAPRVMGPGVWSPAGHKFANTAAMRPIRAPIIICASSRVRDEHIKDAIDQLVAIGKDVGVTIARPRRKIDCRSAA